MSDSTKVGCIQVSLISETWIQQNWFRRHCDVRVGRAYVDPAGKHIHRGVTDGLTEECHRLAGSIPVADKSGLDLDRRRGKFPATVVLLHRQGGVGNLVPEVGDHMHLSEADRGTGPRRVIAENPDIADRPLRDLLFEDLVGE
ncbi:hypothetical protein PJN91_14740 [Mycobacterium kansasii]